MIVFRLINREEYVSYPTPHKIPNIDRLDLSILNYINTMKEIKRYSLISFFLFIIAPTIAYSHLPHKVLPLGNENLIETRTIKELRTGLTHVHITRGETAPEDPQKFTLTFVTQKKEEADKARVAFEQLGMKVEQQVDQKTPDTVPHYSLSAGEFNTRQEALRVNYQAPIGTNVNRLRSAKYTKGAYVIDIIILDPEKYHGRVISAWSERNWRASPLELALKHDAVVASNGSWFEYSLDNISGVSSGASIVEGMWHHEHHRQRQKGSLIAFAEGKFIQYASNEINEGILYIENRPEKGPTLWISDELPPFPEIKWGKGQSALLDGIDRMPKYDESELVAMRENILWHSQISHGHPEELLSMRMVNEKSSGIKLFILATGDKKRILEEETFGQDISLDISISGKPGLNAFYTKYILLRDGVRPDVKYRHNPNARTAIGADANGKIYLISVPSDTALYDSLGASLPDLQNIGEFLGLVNFVSMDAGQRSVSLVIEGEVMGDPHLQPYDEERRVGDSILIIDDK